MKAFDAIFKRSIMKTSHPAPQPQSLSAPSHSSHPMSATPASPLTVIELFQSQGCNSCPPANTFLLSNIPSNDPAHLLLTYEVTYWDHLGWPSTFGDKRWDARQRDYAAVLRQRGVYTPQVLVDGGARPLGGRGWRDLAGTLASPSPQNVEVEVGQEGSGKIVRVREGDGSKKGDVLVVFYEMQPEDVKILRGENRGETLKYRNVVRDVLAIGNWEGEEREFELPAGRRGLEMAVLVQAGRGGVILGAVRA